MARMELLSMSQMMSRPSCATDNKMFPSEGWGSRTYTSSCQLHLFSKLLDCSHWFSDSPKINKTKIKVLIAFVKQNKTRVHRRIKRCDGEALWIHIESMWLIIYRVRFAYSVADPQLHLDASYWRSQRCIAMRFRPFNFWNVLIKKKKK
jgi:hypothetical protein